MRIGLFAGSFNPVHKGHVLLADYLCKQQGLDEVWMVLSPHNPMKRAEGLADDQHRLNMLKLMLEDLPDIKVSDVELHLPRPSYTYRTLQHLSQLYPQHTFVLIIGEDNMLCFDKWKNYQWILEHYEILVYPRGSERHECTYVNMRRVDAPLFPISSTQIRQNLKDNIDVTEWLNPKVCEYIKQYELYV
ncbi:MAG: nicotinate-nucleotide adenylyltransferase [Paludibacteraceae bacterium]|nr:nicotinate-nucleotide adenylyltransferase [Paludibacteraceae bacterium]